MGLRRQFDCDRIARAYFPVRHHDRHHAGLVDDFAVIVAPDRGAHQSRFDDVELDAGTAQTSDFHDRGIAEHQPRPSGRPRRSMPRVVTFSPIWPAAT